MVEELPDTHAGVRIQPHGVALSDVERIIEEIHIAGDAVGAEFGRRMRVDLQVLLGQFVTVLGTPDGGVAQEETLQTSEAVHLGGRY